MARASQGSWLGDEPLYIRVRLAVTPLGSETFRLGCRVCYVRDRGTLVEEEVPVHFLHGTYKKLLEEVARRLTQPGSPSAHKTAS